VSPHLVDALSHPVRLVEKVVPVAQRLLGVLIDRDGDRLNMLETIALTRGSLAQLGECIDPGRAVVLVVPFQVVRASPSEP
jgi:hypothetical protein